MRAAQLWPPILSAKGEGKENEERSGGKKDKLA